MSELKIVGNNKANRIIGSSQNDTIYGGTANDCLKGGEGADVFVYNKGDGNDKILDYTDEDSISIKKDTVTNIKTSGNNTVLELASKGKISLVGGDYDIISYSDSNEEHSYFRNIENFVNFKSSGKIANLKSNYSKETFEPIDYSKYAGKLTTINASAVDQSMNIVGTADDDTIDGGTGKDILRGGNGNDLLYGGIGDDTLYGGKGNDQLWGNEGEDIFVYNLGDGNDSIFGYQNIDKIMVRSGSVGDPMLDRSNNVSFRIGTDKITVLDSVNKHITIIDSKWHTIGGYPPD